MSRTRSVSLNLDSEGFLRRHCGSCGREFKWMQTPAGESQPYSVGHYHCPYCGVVGEQFWTPAQVEYMKAAAAEEVLGPSLRELESSMERMNRSSGGLLKMTLKRSAPIQPTPPSARDDMCRVEFACHPQEPVKVLDEWTAPVHCLICGVQAGGDHADS